MNKKVLLISCFIGGLTISTLTILGFNNSLFSFGTADNNPNTMTFDMNSHNIFTPAQGGSGSYNFHTDKGNVVPFSYTQMSQPGGVALYWAAGGTFFNTEEIRAISKIEISGTYLAAFDLEYGYDKVDGNIKYKYSVSNAWTFTNGDQDTSKSYKAFTFEEGYQPNYFKITQTSDQWGGRGAFGMKIYYSANCTRGEAPKEFNIHDTDYIGYYGRHHSEGNSEYISHSTSGFTLYINVTNSTNSIKANFTGSTNQVTESIQYGKTYCDSTFLNKVNIPNGTSDVTLFSNLGVGLHNIEFKKCNEAQFAQLLLNGLKFEGITVNKRTETRPLIEFYGDSITCGYGNLTDSSHSFSLATEDATLAYTQLTADKLGFRCSSVSYSGIALSVSPFGGPYTMIDFYKQDGKVDWDASKDPAKISVINLGTNDNTSYVAGVNGVPLTNEEKINLMNNYKKNLTTIINTIFNANADSKIIICYDMMVEIHNGFKDIFTTVISDFASKGKTIYSLGFTDIKNTGGADGHPNKDAHAVDANRLYDFIVANNLNK